MADVAADVWSVAGSVVLALAIGGLIVFAVLAVRRYDQAMARPVRDLAAANGWRYEKEGPERLLARFRKFAPLRLGFPRQNMFTEDEDTGGHRVQHVVTGEVRGHHFHVFEYGWTPPAQRRQQDGGKRLRRHGVAAVRTAVSSPGLAVRRRRRLQGEARTRHNDLGLDDRDFNTRFRIASTDHDFARQALRPEVREWMRRSAVDWEWKGHWLVVSWSGRLKAPDVIPVLKKLTGFTDRLPKDMRPERKAEEPMLA